VGTRKPRTVGVEEELLLFTGSGARPAPAGELLRHDDVHVQHELMLEQAEIATAPVSSSDELAELVGADHVHVGIASRAEGTVAVDGMRPWLSVLLALSANSPFWRGTDTGYASYRTIACGRWPTWGPTERFGDPASYDARVAALIESGAALDEGMIYFDARLSARYPTVEIRVADVAQEAGDALLLAALSRALVDAVVAGPGADDPPVALLRAAAWRAARFGLSEDLYDVGERRLRPASAMVDRLVDTLDPVLRANGDETLVRREADRLLRRGTGADLQRADLSATGSPAGVVLAAAERTARG
jgi:carboxylate-amine ligase